MSTKSIEQGKKNLEKYGKATQFTAGSQQAEIARKGGRARQAQVRKKGASREFLKMVLAMQPEKSNEMVRALKKIGADPDAPITVEQVGVLALIKKYMAGDLRAYDMVHEYLEEDPHTLIEEKRLQVERDAVKAIRNSDGFMAAISKKAEEVFEDGGDTPDALEDE